MKTPPELAAATRLALVALLVSLGFSRPSYSALPASGNIGQALIAYRYLVAGFPNEFLISPRPTATSSERDVEALGKGLGLLHCDVRRRLAMSTDSILIPYSEAERWLVLFQERDGTAGSWLVVIQLPNDSQRALVILSSLGPSQTTAFWLRATQQGYAAQLIYDSFKKGTIDNLKWSMIGAASAMKIERNGELLLKELVEPGVGAEPCLVERGRLFRINLSTGRTSFVAPGKMRACNR